MVVVCRACKSLACRNFGPGRSQCAVQHVHLQSAASSAVIELVAGAEHVTLALCLLRARCCVECITHPALGAVLDTHVVVLPLLGFRRAHLDGHSVVGVDLAQCTASRWLAIAAK